MLQNSAGHPSTFRYRLVGRRLTRALFIPLGVVLAIGGYLGIEQLTGNFHPVIAGELYRPAQLSGAQINDVVRKCGIKTIINLRGGQTGQGFYDAEIAASTALGVTHIDFPLSSSKKLTRNQVWQLISIMRSAQRPILMHCKNGADRTGLASALYLDAVV